MAVDPTRALVLIVGLGPDVAVRKVGSGAAVRWCSESG